jgi:type II secretion system protein J
MKPAPFHLQLSESGPARRPRQAGFTLVEILIAIGLLGLVIAAIYSSWTAILRASKVGTDAAQIAQRARITVRTLEDSLGSAQSFDIAQRYYGFVAENGNDAMLSFVCRLAKSFPRGGKFGDLDVRRVTFTLENYQGSSALMLRQNPLLMEMDRDEQDHPLVLAHNVKSFKIECWDSRLNDWIDDWKNTNQLPKCVRLTLKLEGTVHGQEAVEITRIISLPSLAVARTWQGQGQPGAPPNVFQPGVPGAQGNPGGFPGGVPPGGFPPGGANQGNIPPFQPR